MQFKKHVEKLLQNKLVLNFIVTIILALTEEIMEHEFTCAPEPYNKIYFSMFLIVPSGIFFCLSFTIQGFFLNSFDVKKDKFYCMVWQSSFPPSMWIAIVFLDGRYLQCACSINHDESKKPTNVKILTISKIIGLLLVLTITILVLINCWCKKSQNSNPGVNVSENQGSSQQDRQDGNERETVGTTRGREEDGEEQSTIYGEEGFRTGCQPSSSCNQSVTSVLKAKKEEVMELQPMEGMGAASVDREEQHGDEGKAVPGPSGLGTVSREEEKVKADRGRGEEMERAGSGSELLWSSGDG